MSTIRTVHIATEFYPRLTNRDKTQGDGKHTAENFRKQFLQVLDNPEVWRHPDPKFRFDFSGVHKIGPSFANEAFAYFMKYASPSEFRKVVSFLNCTSVQIAIIEEELTTGYRGK